MPEQRSPSPNRWNGIPGLFRSRTNSAPAAPVPVKAPVADAAPAASREMLERRFAGLNQPDALLAAFADGLAGLGGELADMGLRLQAACAETDWSRAARLLRQLLDKYIRTIEHSSGLGDIRSSSERLRDLSVSLLDNMALGLQPASLAEQAELLADGLRQWQPGLALEPLEQELRLLDQQLQYSGHAAQEQRTLLLSLFALLLDNISQLLSPESWLYAELQQVMPLLDCPNDAAGLQQVLQSLRQASYRQSLLQQGLEQTASGLEHFTPRLAGCWTEFATSAAGSQYLDRVRALPLALSQARNGHELVNLLNTLVADTVQLQQQFTALQAQQAQTQHALEQAQARLRQLQADRQQPAASRDPLTGLAAASCLEALIADCLARLPTLNLGLLAITDFASLRRQHGRQASGEQQQRLVQALSPLLHGDEPLLRLPEGLFVVLLPGASLLAAHDRLASLLRGLAAQPLLPALRTSVMAWDPTLSLDQHLDRLEAALPGDEHGARVGVV